MVTTPTLELEHELFNSGVRYLAGVDEVGRGALAGPVSVGVAIIDVTKTEVPKGLRDSKQLSKAARERIIESVREWVTDYAVGHATAEEIDELGIMGGLRLAWYRAYAALDIKPDHVLLDGKHNWIAEPESNLFNQSESPDLPVTMKIKADATCAVVSAGSVLAKVERDQMMVELARQHPQFGWEGNVGYGSSGHMDAIRTLGPTQFHRRSWNLPTSDSSEDSTKA